MIKKILNYTFFLISLFTILTYDVNALQTDPSAVQFFDNYGSYLTPISTEKVDNIYYGYLGLTANSTGGAIGLRLNENIVNGHMYSLTLNIGVPAGGYTSASSKNIIGVGSDLTNAINSYVNSNGSIINYTQGGTYEASYYISFVFTSKVTGSYIVVPYNTINGCLGSCENFFKGYTLNDLGSADNLTDSEVNSIINNQTYVIQNSINNIENSINNTITDNFNDCYTNIFNSNSYNSNSFTNLSISDNNITASANSSWKTLSYNFSVIPNEVYTLYYTSPDDIAVYYYNPDNVDFSRLNKNSFTQIIPTTNNLIIRLQNSESGTVHFNNLMLVKGNVSRFISYGQEYCSNKIDSTNDKLDQTNQQLGDLNDNITDSNVSGVEESFSNFENFLDDNSTITQLITLPVTLYSSILQGVSNSCSPFNLGSLYGENLILPCINIGNYLGSTLWGMIDLIISGFAVYSISKKLIKVFNNFSSMKDGDVIDD